MNNKENNIVKRLEFFVISGESFELIMDDFIHVVSTLNDVATTETPHGTFPHFTIYKKDIEKLQQAQYLAKRGKGGKGGKRKGGSTIIYHGK